MSALKSIIPFSLYYTYQIYSESSTKNNVCNDTNMLDRAKKAICIMNPDGDSTAKGIVEMGQIQPNRPVHIKAVFTGLAVNSKHGFHIHQWGNLTKGCSTAGPHFNPENKSHGGPDSEERHVGDLGNVVSDSQGNGKYELVDSKITLFGVNSVVGRSCVLHKDEDDLGLGNFSDSKTTGHSGSRIACGVIGLTDFTKEDLKNYLF
jgi:Cu-Zn family superoxide dismutase